MSFLAISCAETILDFRGLAATSQSTAGQLIAAVSSKGGDDSMDAGAAQSLGLGHREFPVKEIDMTQGADSRGIAVGTVDDRTYLFLYHTRRDDVWMFRISKSGVIQKAIYGLTRQGFHDLPTDKAAAQVNEEEKFWSDWLANGSSGTGGGKGESKN
jgi:hypothetical protein